MSLVLDVSGSILGARLPIHAQLRQAVPIFLPFVHDAFLIPLRSFHTFEASGTADQHPSPGDATPLKRQLVLWI